MQILITGGAGFVGAATAKTLMAAGHDVVTLDSKNLALQGESSWREHVIADITDDNVLDELLPRFHFDAILHAAAFPSITSCELDPVAAFEVNVTGTARIVAAAGRFGVRRVVTVSTEEVYGDSQSGSVSEEDPTDPVSVYGATKLAAELAGRTIGLTVGVEHIAARLSWAYGPGYPRPRLPTLMILDAMAGRPTVLTTGAEHVIDLTYITDATEAFCLLLTASSLKHDVYNVSGGATYTPVGVARAVQRVFPNWQFDIGPGVLCTDAGKPLPRQGALALDRIRELGYTPRVRLDEGIRHECAAIKDKALEAQAVRPGLSL